MKASSKAVVTIILLVGASGCGRLTKSHAARIIRDNDQSAALICTLITGPATGGEMQHRLAVAGLIDIKSVTEPVLGSTVDVVVLTPKGKQAIDANLHHPPKCEASNMDDFLKERGLPTGQCRYEIVLAKRDDVKIASIEQRSGWAMVRFTSNAVPTVVGQAVGAPGGRNPDGIEMNRDSDGWKVQDDHLVKEARVPSELFVGIKP